MDTLGVGWSVKWTIRIDGLAFALG